jgi:Cu-processing system permease protein
MTATAALAGWELRTAARSRWITAFGAVFGAACLAVAVFGLRTLKELGQTGSSAVADGLLVLGVLLPPLLGLVAGAGSIAGARERGTLAMFLTQPLRPGSVVAGAFLGLTGAVWCVVAVAFGAAAVAVAAVADTADLVAYAAVTGAALATGAVAVAIGIAISSLAANRMQAIATAAAAWFVLAIGADLVLAVVVPSFQLGPRGMLAAVLLNPLESVRILAVLTIDGDGRSLGSFGAHLLDRFGSSGSRLVLLAGVAAWIAVPLAVARAAVRRRDA